MQTPIIPQKPKQPQPEPPAQPSAQPGPNVAQKIQNDPTPWAVDGCIIRDASGRVIVDTSAIRDSCYNLFSAANAELIVNAVNAYRGINANVLTNEPAPLLSPEKEDELIAAMNRLADRGALPPIPATPEPLPEATVTWGCTCGRCGGTCADDPAFTWECHCAEPHVGQTCAEHQRARYAELLADEIDHWAETRKRLVALRRAVMYGKPSNDKTPTAVALAMVNALLEDALTDIANRLNELTDAN